MQSDWQGLTHVNWSNSRDGVKNQDESRQVNKNEMEL